MSVASRPTFHAVVQAAVEATGASRGWLLRVDTDGFVVVAAHPHDTTPDLVGTRREARGAAGFVASSGQPAAMQIRPGDADNEGAGGVQGSPFALLAAPCGGEDVVGVLELVDPEGGAFSFDDVETVALLADIGGAALEEDDPTLTPPSPDMLTDGLNRLANNDSVRYAAVARAIEAML